MNTLVIHPEDTTTDFLKKIYEGKNFTIAKPEEMLNETVLKELIKKHDRIVMLGHGNGNGLLGGPNLDIDFVINESFVNVLNGKDLICIWCYATEFINGYKVNPKRVFYTGMFISEELEADFWEKYYEDEKEIEESNYTFSREFRKEYIDSDNRSMKKLIKNYCKGVNSDIRYFNSERLFDKVLSPV